MRRTLLGTIVVLLFVVVGWASVSDAHEGHGQASPQASPGAGTPTATGMGAAYLTITNQGEEADRLLGGETDVAAVVEIHEMSEKDGVMEMRPLADGLEIPAGETVELKPRGYHIMLIGLTRDLNRGDRYELTLQFEKAGEVTVTVEVLPTAEPAEGTPVAPVTAGDLTISNVWSRPAPALGGATHMGTPEATPGTHGM